MPMDGDLKSNEHSAHQLALFEKEFPLLDQGV
eukprot:CAMPEP_0183298992 /NCGR_PEP_ID=MMETSP0160_2-20130417/5842_1 /TAXON_ID=2839 ORGANISM="Odontella Sinensis, Strain Grunow 1884" /NCGR_SAMPLE_ID=MMETSP0160_2 /ASSEMBLY_ACC=CAM_ASM_000250 /LENGTH=31 /DNA_ID= /DNA_START= /DNA_END= /DNA_ORIENTATION=